MSDQHDDTASSDPAAPTNERDELVEALGRRVGAELRSPAPEHGVTSIARRARSRTAVVAAGAAGGAVLVVALVMSPFDTTSQLDSDGIAGGPSNSVVASTSPPPGTATSAEPTVVDVPRATTVPATAQPPATSTAPTTQTPPPDYTPGARVEIEPQVNMTSWVYGNDDSRLYQLDAGTLDPTAWELVVRDATTLDVTDRLACPASVDDGGEPRWSPEIAASWDAGARSALSDRGAVRRLNGIFSVGCPMWFSADGTIAYHALAEFSDQPARTALWDTEAGDIVAVLEGHVAALSPDGSMIVTVDSRGSSGTRVWDARTGEFIEALHGDEQDAPSRDANVGAVFSPDGTRLITTGPSIEVWTVRGWTRTYAIAPECPCSLTLGNGTTGSWLAADVSPDSRHLAATQGLETTVFDLSTGTELFRFTPREGARNVPYYVTGLGYSPDGHFIVNELFDTRYDGNEPRVVTVGLHDSNTGTEFELPTGADSDEFPYRVAFSPDGRSMVLVTSTADESGAIQSRLQRWTVS